MPPMHVNSGVLVQLLQDSTGGSVVIALSAVIKHHAVYIRGNGATGGTVQIATSSANGYSGTFAPLGAAVPVPANGETVVNIGPGVLNCLKVTLAGISGGNASVYYFGG